jgi:hypothetical protein
MDLKLFPQQCLRNSIFFVLMLPPTFPCIIPIHVHNNNIPLCFANTWGYPMSRKMLRSVRARRAAAKTPASGVLCFSHERTNYRYSSGVGRDGVLDKLGLVVKTKVVERCRDASRFGPGEEGRVCQELQQHVGGPVNFAVCGHSGERRRNA